MKKLGILTVLIFLKGILFGQASFVFENRTNPCHGLIVVKAWKNGKLFEIGQDTLSGERLRIELPKSTEPGLLSIEFAGDYPLKNCELVFDGKDIHLQLFNGKDGTPRLSTDPETEFYWRANQIIDSLRLSLLELRKLIVVFAADHDSLSMLLERRNKETHNRLTELFEVFKKKNVYTTASSLLLSRNFYVPDWHLTSEEQSNEILQNYFKLNDYNNRVFQNSPFFTQKITDYLELLSMTVESAKDSVLITGIDKFFINIAADDTLLKDITLIMRSWLLQNGFDAVIEFIDVKYLSAQCLSQSDEGLQERLKAYKLTAKGQTAPEIVWQKDLNKDIKLSELQAKNVLIVFWASWCQHCMETLPEIYKYSQKEGIAVVAIALESVEETWKKAIEVMPNWNHLRASAKWNDPIVKLYGVYGTPTIFVLDSKKKILGKVTKLNDIIILTK